MGFVSKNLDVRRKDNRNWILQSDLVYEGSTDRFTVPAGFETDFASVPRPVQALIPSTGVYTEAAILHDYFCVMLAYKHKMLSTGRVNELRNSGWVELVDGGWTKGNPGPRDTDGIFRRVMRELGVPFFRRWLIWTGVRWGALFNPARRAGWHNDAVGVVLLSILFAPYVLPVGVLTTFFLALGWVASVLIK